MRYAAASLLAVAVAASVVKILPLGDSLTAGCGTLAGPQNNWTSVWQSGNPPYSTLSGGFRAPLFSALTAQGFDVELVGSQGPHGPAELPAAAKYHEGHPGITIRALHALLPTWSAFAPDVILLMIGANDINQNRTLGNMTADLAALLHDARAAVPRATLIVQTLMQMVVAARPDFGAAVAAYNAALPAVAAAAGALLLDSGRLSGLCTADGSPLRRLCTECNEAAGGRPAACVVNTSNYDRVHPTLAGYSLLAGYQAAFIGALLEQRAEDAA
jgi:lysophospholipase L1-like esterase